MCSLQRAATLKRRASFSGKTRSELLLLQHSVEPEPEEENSDYIFTSTTAMNLMLELLSLKVIFEKVHLQLLHGDNF